MVVKCGPASGRTGPGTLFRPGQLSSGQLYCSVSRLEAGWEWCPRVRQSDGGGQKWSSWTPLSCKTCPWSPGWSWMGRFPPYALLVFTDHRGMLTWLQGPLQVCESVCWGSLFPPHLLFSRFCIWRDELSAQEDMAETPPWGRGSGRADLKDSRAGLQGLFFHAPASLTY